MKAKSTFSASSEQVLWPWRITNPLCPGWGFHGELVYTKVEAKQLLIQWMPNRSRNLLDGNPYINAGGTGSTVPYL